jgi:4-oxalocrotonate tautomerase
MEWRNTPREMPYVSATLQAPPSAELTARIIGALTDLTVDVLGKERARTTVVVHYVPAGQWARGGSALPVRGYFVEVKVTAGTNLRNDKARYVREVNRTLQSLLGEASGYVAVAELAADSWGYTGETQELHYVRATLASDAAEAESVRFT